MLMNSLAKVSVSFNGVNWYDGVKIKKKIYHKGRKESNNPVANAAPLD